MSEWTVHLELVEGASSKFWRARVEGKTLYVNYGKIGAAGQTQVKDFPDAAGAAKEYDKLVREKRKKGYVDAGAGSSRDDDDDEDIHAPDDDDDDGDDDDDDDDEPARKPPERKPAARPAPAAKPAPAARAPDATLVLDAGSRRVETRLYLDGKTVRLDAIEAYASPEAARKAFDRLRKALAGEGYKEG